MVYLERVKVSPAAYERKCLFTILGLFWRRLAMIFDALSSLRRTSTYTWEPYFVRSRRLFSWASNMGQGSKKHTCGLFCRRITSTDNSQGLIPIDWKGECLKTHDSTINVPEYGYSTITDGASTDAALPVSLFALQPHPLCAGSSRNDDGVCCLWFLVFLHFTPVAEWPGRQINFGNSLCDNLCAKAHRLFPKFVHELGTKNTTREAGEVLDYNEFSIKFRWYIPIHVPSVVVVSWPPAAKPFAINPSNSTGFKLARAR